LLFSEASGMLMKIDVQVLCRDPSEQVLRRMLDFDN
jgi:hypothetical protein